MPTAPTQVDQGAVPVTMSATYDEVGEPLVKKEGSMSPNDPRVDNSVTPETDTATLLAELVRLQAENNKLSKRQISATEEMDF